MGSTVEKGIIRMSAAGRSVPVTLLVILLLAGAPVRSAHAGIGAWRVHTDMRSARAVAADGAVLWAATAGGVFRFDPADSSYVRYTTADGLTSNDVTAIAIDPSHRVWTGQASGAIDVFDPRTGVWTAITDITLSGRADRTIRSFTVAGDRLYIATAFGIALFSLDRFEFVDTYINFATASQPSVAAAALHAGRVAAATNRGIAVSKPSAVNLAAPESWELLSADVTGTSFGTLSGSLYAGTSSGLLRFDGSAFVPVPAVAAGVRIVGQTDSALVLFGSSVLQSYSSAGVLSVLSDPVTDAAAGGAIAAGNVPVTAFAQNGAAVFDPLRRQWRTYFPNGPRSNSFYQIAVDSRGVVWAVSGRSNGKGFYRYDGERWRNYHTGNEGLVSSNDCFNVEIGPNHSAWIGTWGSGLVLANAAGDLVRTFGRVSPGFVGISENLNYIVPGGTAVDRDGSVWVNVFRASRTDSVLWRMAPDSTWTVHRRSPFGNAADWYMFDLIIDRNGTKWFTNAARDFSNDQTLTFYNERGTLPNDVNNWGTLTVANGLTSSYVTCIAMDRNGDVWLGTSSGITIVTDPSDPARRLSEVFVGAVRDQFVYAVAVDPLNNKWVGTSKGVFILSPDGTQLLDQYTVENTGGKLADNAIFSIAFDRTRGIAYIGTEKGLSSLEMTAVEPATAISSIALSPNPVYLPEHRQVEIRGLVEESTVKVLTVYGKVLRQFPAQGGGRALWDCTDGEGRTVASGIYIIVAHDRTGAQTGTAKVAVIRR